MRGSWLSRDSIASIALIVSTLTAVTATVLFARQVIHTPRNSPAKVVGEPLGGWQQYSQGGHRIGPPNAPGTIVVFSDYECPFCAKLEVDLAAIRRANPTNVAIVYHQMPLPIHEHSASAAVAALCAADQGRFEEMHNYLFSHQRELGATVWTAAARETSVADTVRFAQCMHDSSSTIRALQADASAAEKLNVSGTPTIVVNGLVYRGSPGRNVLASQVSSAIRRSLDGRPDS